MSFNVIRVVPCFHFHFAARTVRREAGVRGVRVRGVPALDQGEVEPEHAGDLAEFPRFLLGFFLVGGLNPSEKY